MQVKRYRASSMQEALEKVREELGDDAVILRTEKIQNPSLLDLMKNETVEVVAATESDMQSMVPSAAKPKSSPRVSQGTEQSGGRLSYFAPKPIPDISASTQQTPTPRTEKEVKAFSDLLNQRLNHAEATVNKEVRKKSSGLTVEQKKKSSKSSQTSNPAAKSTAKKTKTKPVSTGSRLDQNMRNTNKISLDNQDNIDTLRNELHDLRSMVNSLSVKMTTQNDSSMKEISELPDLLSREMIHLADCGIEKRIAWQLIEEVQKQLKNEEQNDSTLVQEILVESLMKRLDVAGPIECKKGKTKVIALVGPTGSGKTSTLAKLAANSKFTVNKKVALISIDTYRVSALEHLSNFAGLAQLPISAVYSAQELKGALVAHEDKDLIFIDTAGRSPRDERYLKDLKTYMDLGKPDEIHLVLPANMKSLDLIDCLRRFENLGVNRIVFTKIDETSSLGSLVNLQDETDHPISYITNGQTIPDDIKLANEQALARLILRIG